MKYKIWDGQLNQYFSDEEIFDTKKEAVDRLVSFHSVDCRGDLRRIRGCLWQSNEFAELYIEKVE